MLRGGWLTLFLVAGTAGSLELALTTAPAFGAEKELTTAEHVSRLKRKNVFSQLRSDSARKLGTMKEAAELRDSRTVEILLDIALDSTDDMLVRMETIKALAEIQDEVYNPSKEDYAINKYMEPFIAILKDDKHSDPLIRTEVARALGRTLRSDRVKHKDGFDAMLLIAEDANRNGMKPTPLILRIACVDGLGNFGATRAFVSFASILVQENLDPLLREAVIRGLGNLVNSIDLENNLEAINLATLNRIKEMVSNKKMPPDIRGEALKLLGRLIGAGAKVGVSFDLLPIAVGILKDQEVTDPVLILAAIQTLGLLGDEDGVRSLEKAYTDFFDDKNVARENDVNIRTEVMRTLGQLLARMTTDKKRTNPGILKIAVGTLLKPLNPDATPKEAGAVVDAAIFSIRYLYPNEPEYAAGQKAAIERLILTLKKSTDEDQKSKIMDTLTLLSRRPFGTDVRRWENWFDEIGSKHGQ